MDAHDIRDALARDARDFAGQADNDEQDEALYAEVLGRLGIEVSAPQQMQQPVPGAMS